MANEETFKAAPVAKAKGYKLAKGASLDLRNVPYKVTNAILADPAKLAFIQARCPEAFGVLIVAA